MNEPGIYRGFFTAEEPVADDKTSRTRRDRYFDALRAAALVRVVVYHMFPGRGFRWCFPPWA